MKTEDTNNEHTNDETETLRQENEGLKQQMRLMDAREKIGGELTAAGAISPGLLFDLISGKIEFDDDGKPVNTAELVTTVKSEFPEQFETHKPAASIDAGSGRSDAKAYLTAEALTKMTAAEIKQLDWAEVKQVLSNQR